MVLVRRGGRGGGVGQRPESRRARSVGGAETNECGIVSGTALCRSWLGSARLMTLKTPPLNSLLCSLWTLDTGGAGIDHCLHIGTRYGYCTYYNSSNPDMDLYVGYFYDCVQCTVS